MILYYWKYGIELLDAWTYVCMHALCFYYLHIFYSYIVMSPCPTFKELPWHVCAFTSCFCLVSLSVLLSIWPLRLVWVKIIIINFLFYQHHPKCHIWWILTLIHFKWEEFYADNYSIHVFDLHRSLSNARFPYLSSILHACCRGDGDQHEQQQNTYIKGADSYKKV